MTRAGKSNVICEYSFRRKRVRNAAAPLGAYAQRVRSVMESMEYYLCLREAVSIVFSVWHK